MRYTIYIAFLFIFSLCYAFTDNMGKMSVVDLCKAPTYVQQVMTIQPLNFDAPSMSYNEFEKYMQKENANWDQFILDDSRRPEIHFNSYNIHFRRLIYDDLHIKYGFYSWMFDVLNMQKVKYINAYEDGMLNDPNLKKLYIANYSAGRPHRNKYFLYYEASYDRLNKTINRLKPGFIKIYNKLIMKCIVISAIIFDIDVKKAKASLMFEEKDKTFTGFIDNGAEESH